MAFKILYEQRALADLRDVTAYVAAEDPQAAERLGTAILDQIDLLEEHPRLGRVLPRQADPDFRELIHRPYRILYEVSERDNLVTIHRIWHSARGIPEF